MLVTCVKQSYLKLETIKATLGIGFIFVKREQQLWSPRALAGVTNWECSLFWAWRWVQGGVTS